MSTAEQTAEARAEWYEASMQAMEQDLQPKLHGFPVTIELGDQAYSFNLWRGQQLPDRLLAYDTETAAIEGSEIPQLALAAVHGDQGSCYFVHPDDLPQFIQQHADRYWCCHNACFDFWTTAQHLQSDPQACAAWWDLAGDSRLYCTMLSDALIRLASIDAEPVNRDLAKVAADYCPGIRLNKDDPYRLRYAELIGLPADAWIGTELGFWTYAACDPIATLQIAQRQFQIASELSEPHRGELLPDALRRFGPLTVCLQVQGSIALDYISRTGVQIDLPQAEQLHDAIAALVDQHCAELEQLLPGCFKRYGPRSKQAGQLQTTDAGVPKRNAKVIKQHLEQIAKQADEPIRPARNKDELVTDAVKYWKQHRDLHQFIAAYVAYSEQAKLAQFFKQLDQPHIYPRYRPLVRSGRSSCSDPNLQQLPRDSRFREMIVARAGSWLLQIDYSVLELRTLAQISLRRFGQSVLADLFRQGIDPHRYTAALLLGMDQEQFAQLPAAEQKQHRQRAKAINFGVPGGLGAASLVAYAKHSYGVELSIDEARQFRQRLIEQVYPELSAYLRDSQHQTIADNLQATAAQARQALPRREQIQTAQRIVSGCESTPDGDEYQPELIDHVWLLMQQLNGNPDLMPDLIARQSSTELMRRCFYRTVATISGRLRGHVGFSQAANSPFQGLAADGNKLALFRLLRAGFQVCGFVHDEMLILLPAGCDYRQAVDQVQQILCDAMQELCPDIPISTEYLLADRWYKDAPEQPTDQAGQIIPFTRPLAAAPQIEQPQIDQSAKVEQPAEQVAPVQPKIEQKQLDLHAEQPADPQPDRKQPKIEQPDQQTQLDPPAEQKQPKRQQRKPVTSKATPAKSAPQQLTQPIKWHGGKHYLAKQIIGLMPEHTHYCEPYAGGLSVLLQKDPQEISEVVNDLHGELISFWQVLADPQQFDQFYRRLECTPLAQPLFDAATEQAGSATDRAVQFFIRARQSRQGLQRDYCTPTRRTRRGMNEQVSAWLTAVAGLPDVHQRLLRVEIRNLPAVQFIQRYDHAACMFYCDPPYLHSTRSSTGEYACEMSEADHRQLLDCLAGIEGKFLLSGYPSDLYDQYAQQHGWRCVQVQIDNKASSAKQKQIKTECLWMNYSSEAKP